MNKNHRNRNVVLVTIDSLRADHCGYMGYERNTTPTLDEMSKNGVTFENAIAPGPSTPESMPIVLTGSYPTDGVRTYPSLLAKRRAVIHRHMATHETLADRFRTRGYATAGISPNPYTSRYFGFDSGFDYFEDFIDGSREALYQSTLDGIIEGTPLSALFPARVLLNWVGREEVFKPWEAFYERVLDWIGTIDTPYFLWILLMDTHDPYLAPTGYRTQSRWATYRANWRLWRQNHEPPFSSDTRRRLVTAYDDAIRYADSFLAHLRDDLGDNPIIAVHGDHGEAFGEHGTYGHHPYLYEENVHVPFVIDGVENDAIEEPVSLRRVPELLIAAAGNDEPIHAVESGVTRCRTMDGERRAIRGKTRKYIRGPDTDRTYDLGSSESPTSDAEFREIGRRLTDRWIESDREYRRVQAAAERVSDGV